MRPLLGNALFPFQEILEKATPFLVFLLTLLVGYLFERLLLRRITRWAKTTSLKDILIPSIKTPLFIGVFLLALYFAVGVSGWPHSMIRTTNKILWIVTVLDITFVLADLASRVIKVYAGRSAATLPVASLTQNIARSLIFSIGILIVLNHLGISILPILATLGVGSLAVALALQNTLSNLFSGFYIIMVRQIRIGDYIQLNSGEEGYVTDITWRTTQIRTRQQNIVLVPNEKLTQAIVTNYYFPAKETTILIDFGVHHKSDLKKVEQVTSAVAQEVMREVAGGVPAFAPFIRYHTVADFSINFTVTLKAQEFSDQYLLKHEFIKRLHERYAQEGIMIPYPIRAINHTQEKSDEAMR